VYRKTLRALTALIAGTLAGAGPVRAEGYGPYSGYQGDRFPATAAVFATLPTSPFDDASPVVLSYFLDTTGDRRADVAHAAMLDSESFGVAALLGAYVSPSDPNVVYALAVPVADGTYQVQTYRRTSSDGWERIGETPIPAAVASLGGMVDTPASRTFESGHVHIMALRRVDGGDWILVVATTASRGGQAFQSRFAILRDGPDAGPFADAWTEPVEIPNTEAVTLDARGRVLARRIDSAARPFNSAGFLRVVDSNGDGAPDTADASSFVAVAGSAFGAYGPGDVDLGADRLLAGPYATLDLDSRGRPIAGSERDILGPCAAGCGIAYTPFQLWSGRDGSALAFAHHTPNAPVEQPDVIAMLDDLDFDGFSGFHHSATPFEAREVVRDSLLPHPMMRAGSVADLAELSFDEVWSTNSFRDFGVFPNGEAFTFRMGSRDFEHISVSKNGLVSFLGPVAGEASFSGLRQSRGVIAPAWSDAWDTSAVRVLAGYAPANISFVDGARVLAFTIEWRGLRLPGWDSDRCISVRLVMFEDGSFRTDFGAFEAAELDSHRFVVGYAGIGSHFEGGEVDLTNHSWGGAPVGDLAERVVGEEFGPAKPSDLGHRWVRWSGYPERLDPSTPPVLINARLKSRKKIVMTAAGSNIRDGARLLVDGVESFELALNGAGTKWVVRPSALSMPGNKTVKSVWSDRQAHEIVVVNPEGDSSSAGSLP
jgi:hypothetical protein